MSPTLGSESKVVNLSRRQVLTGAALASVATFLNVRPAEAGATSPVLFVAAHPDDETIAMGVALAEHIAAGQDIHVLWLTRGEGSAARAMLNGDTVSGWWGVRHSPATEGYSRLGASAFGQARIEETTAAVRCLGSVTTHEAELADGNVTTSTVKAAILAVADQIAPGGPVRIKTHTYVVENHPDHLAAGYAAHSLKVSNPARFGDVRHYILPTFWTDPRLSKVTEVWDRPASTEIRRRVLNAYRAFGAWHPPASYAIGEHSVCGMFAKLTADPKSLFHA